MGSREGGEEGAEDHPSLSCIAPEEDAAAAGAGGNMAWSVESLPQPDGPLMTRARSMPLVWYAASHTESSVTFWWLHAISESD